MSEPDKPEIASLIGYRILRLAALMAHQAKLSSKQLLDLSQAQWRVLAQLAAGGEQNPNVIAVELGLKRSHVTQAVRELKKRKLVSEKPDLNDGRRILLYLTRSGKKLAEHGVLAFAPRRERLVSALTDHERRSLESALTKITLTVQQMIAEAEAGRRAPGGSLPSSRPPRLIRHAPAASR
jgi:DNA-binding MarR family transcriptional regulator